MSARTTRLEAMKERSPTTIRFTDDDLSIIRRLEKLAGLEGTTAVIRMALREALAVWEKKTKR
jgi:hypothetical protein